MIIEHDNEPICSIEVSQEAGTGHNAFQRFPRIAASVENNVPSLYIYPEGIVVTRGANSKWDMLNPNIFAALERAMQIYDVPALLYYFPTDCPKVPSGYPNTKGKMMDKDFPSCPDSNHKEMKDLFETVNLILHRTLRAHTTTRLLNERIITNRRSWMQREYSTRGGKQGEGSPISATIEVETPKLIGYLKKFNPACNPNFLTKNKRTIIYQVDAGIRGDPYPGALAALDYLLCRRGKSFEDRDKNLVLAWGKIEEEKDNLKVICTKPKGSSVEEFMKKVRVVSADPSKSLLDRNFKELKPYEIPRYYLHMRYGSMFTKTKEIRCYAYFADAILFHDGAFWREG